MRKLIRADIDRILRKKTIWVIAAIMIIYITFMVLLQLKNAPDRSFVFTTAAYNGISLAGLLIGFMLILNIYAADFKAMSLIGVIGRGISREKLILAKCVDTLLILINMYLIAGLYVMLLKNLLGISITSLEAKFIFLTCLNNVICTTASVMIAALFFYLTENTPLGIIVYMTLEIIIPIVLQFVSAMPAVAKYHPERLYYNGAAASMTADFMIGAAGAGILKFILINAVYICGAVAGTMLLFRRKELEF